MIVGPQMFSLTFAYFIAPEHSMPSAPWYLAAMLLVLSLGIAWSEAKDRKRDKEGVVGLATAEAEVT